MPVGSYSHKKGKGASAWKGGRIVNNGYYMVYAPGHARASVGGGYYVYEHVLIAEQALGRALPAKAEVHHVNEIKTDNTHSNLVICENRGYHRLLHMRMNALQATGNPDARCCSHCKRWELDLTQGTINSRSFRHRRCHAQYMRQHKKKTRDVFDAAVKKIV